MRTLLMPWPQREREREMASMVHVVIFPFMSKGHTIPILHLARLLLHSHRHAAITIFTTPANRPFISQTLADTDTSIINLPFPENIDGVPAGVESTDRLPSMSLFVPFANATKLIQPHFERALERLQHVSCLISDAFLGWTLESASKFGIPRLVFSGMSNFSMTLSALVAVNRLLSGPESDDQPVTVTNFPWIKLTRNDFEAPINERQPKGPHWDFIIEQAIATSKSHGTLVNSFNELEALYFDYWNRNFEPKAWCVGPLCLAQPQEVELQTQQKPTWVQWLDQKLAQGSSVLYIAFGSQAQISSEQLCEIATALEESKLNFLWVVKKNEPQLFNGFEERVKLRGLVVREWVNQREILGHESVQGFLSHCGWNSVLESICAKVPILAWPMMAEQHLNARMVVEEIKVALRVETSNGSVRGFVKWEGLEKMVRELMEGEMGKEVRKKVEEVGVAAAKALEEGGSSWCSLNQLMDEMHSQTSD
uniref:Glycosyltransferase n=1 Tax=Davidia involucrata TaxID=16924 RepID=A0A5B6ZQC2_DAVIN